MKKISQSISASDFKAKCLKLMDEVEETQKSIIITKYGEPVAKLSPIKKAGQKKHIIFAAMEGSVNITGDIISSIDDEIWDAEQ